MLDSPDVTTLELKPGQTAGTFETLEATKEDDWRNSDNLSPLDDDGQADDKNPDLREPTDATVWPQYALTDQEKETAARLAEAAIPSDRELLQNFADDFSQLKSNLAKAEANAVKGLAIVFGPLRTISEDPEAYAAVPTEVELRETVRIIRLATEAGARSYVSSHGADVEITNDVIDEVMARASDKLVFHVRENQEVRETAPLVAADRYLLGRGPSLTHDIYLQGGIAAVQHMYDLAKLATPPERQIRAGSNMPSPPRAWIRAFLRVGIRHSYVGTSP